jgi:choline-glycine betaine transporter
VSSTGHDAAKEATDVLGAIAILSLVAAGLLRILGLTKLSNRLLLVGIAFAFAVPILSVAFSTALALLQEHAFAISLFVVAIVVIGVVKGVRGPGRPEKLSLKKRVDG